MKDQVQIPWFHGVANILLRLILPVFLKLDVQGLEHTPKQGPLIAAINHTSFLDPVVTIAYVREDVLPMAKVELFRFPWGLVFANYGAFPIRRGEGDRAALRRALQIVGDNHVMLISPEGTRSKSGALETAREGIALLALKSRAPILPVAVWGGKQFWHNLGRFRRTPFGLRVGEPLGITPLAGRADRQTLRAITDELMYYIAQMLPPEYRGRYAEAGNIVPRYVKPLNDLALASAPPSEEVVGMS